MERVQINLHRPMALASIEDAETLIAILGRATPAADVAPHTFLSYHNQESQLTVTLEEFSHVKG